MRGLLYLSDRLWIWQVDHRPQLIFYPFSKKEKKKSLYTADDVFRERDQLSLLLLLLLNIINIIIILQWLGPFRCEAKWQKLFEILWAVWLYRNEEVFHGRQPSVMTIIYNARSLADTWHRWLKPFCRLYFILPFLLMAMPWGHHFLGDPLSLLKKKHWAVNIGPFQQGPMFKSKFNSMNSINLNLKTTNEKITKITEWIYNTEILKKKSKITHKSIHA